MSFFRTLKARILLSSTILFSLLTLIAFWGILFSLTKHLDSKTDAELTRQANNLSDIIADTPEQVEAYRQQWQELNEEVMETQANLQQTQSTHISQTKYLGQLTALHTELLAKQIDEEQALEQIDDLIMKLEQQEGIEFDLFDEDDDEELTADEYGKIVIDALTQSISDLNDDKINFQDELKDLKSAQKELSIEKAKWESLQDLYFLPEQFDYYTQLFGRSESLYLVIDAQGKVLLSSNKAKKKPKQSSLQKIAGMKDHKISNAELLSQINFRYIRVAVPDSDKSLIICLSRQQNLELITYYKKVFFWSLLIMLICSGGIGYLIMKKSLHGIELLRGSAERVRRKGDYSLRIAATNQGEEIDQLTSSFNLMLGTTEKLIDEINEISNSVAHDLRTPVTRLQALAQNTLLGKKDLSSAEFAEKVLEECEVQARIINSLLTIAQCESGQLQLAKEKIRPGKLLQELTGLYESLAEERNIHITCQFPPKDCKIFTDGNRLRQALANLIDNAVKYSPDHSQIALGIQLNAQELSFTVQDQGAGISIEDQEKIFKRFYRADPSRSLPGNGLGLSLAQSFIKALGGHISLHSELGKGCLFTIHLPLASEQNY